MENGGDFVTGFVPRNFSEITLKNRIKYVN